MIDKKYIKTLAKSLTQAQQQVVEKKVKISFSTSAENKEFLKSQKIDISNILDEFVSSLCEELQAIQKEEMEKKISATIVEKPESLEEKVTQKIEEKKNIWDRK